MKIICLITKSFVEQSSLRSIVTINIQKVFYKNISKVISFKHLANCAFLLLNLFIIKNNVVKFQKLTSSQWKRIIVNNCLLFCTLDITNYEVTAQKIKQQHLFVIYPFLFKLNWQFIKKILIILIGKN